MAFQSFVTVLKAMVWFFSAKPFGAVDPPLMTIDMPSVRVFIVPKALGVCGRFDQLMLVQVGWETANVLATSNAHVSDSVVSAPATLLSPP